MRITSKLLPLAAALALLSASKVAGAVIKLAERQENLATVCSRYNVNCLRIASGMFIPESDDIAATEPQSDGSTLMLLNADKASGNVQCGSSVALWSLAGGSGDRTFDGRDQNGVKNTRISGYFSSDPSKKTTHGVLKTNAIGADLVLQCSPGSASALDGIAVRDAEGHLGVGLERRETLADVCGRKGNMCLRISSNMFTPDTESFTGSEKQPDGSILLLVDNAGGSGRAQCGNDIVRWSLNSREKTYDGRSLNGDRNERIRGYFTSDPSKSTIHFVLKTTADADLVMTCT